MAIVGGDFNAVSCRQMRVSQRALDAADHALRSFELDSARCSHVGCALRPARAGEEGHANADEGAGAGPLKRVMHDNDARLPFTRRAYGDNGQSAAVLDGVYVSISAAYEWKLEARPATATARSQQILWRSKPEKLATTFQ